MACILSVVLVGVVSACADPPLRYDFRVGSHLIYDYRVRVGPLDSQQISERYSEQIQLWVLERSGYRAMLIGECARVDQTGLGPARGVTLRIDARGNRELPAELQREESVFRPLLWLLPGLPPAFDSGQQWDTPIDARGIRLRCRRAGADAQRGGAQRIEFVADDTLGVWALLGIELRGTYWFDTDAGRVVRLEYERVDRTHGRLQRVVARLYEQRQVTQQWCRLRLPLVEKHLFTIRLEQHLRERIGNEPELAEQIVDAMQRVWTERLRELSRGKAVPFERWVAGRRRLVRANRERFMQQARIAAEWMSGRQALQERAGADEPRATLLYYFDPAGEDDLRGLAELAGEAAALSQRGWRVVAVVVPSKREQAARCLERLAPQLEWRLGGAALPAGASPVYRALDGDGRTNRVHFGWWPRRVAELAAQSPE